MGLMVRFMPDQAAARLLSVLRKANWNLSQAAEEMGVDRRTFNRWLEALGRRGFMLRSALDQGRQERIEKRACNKGKNAL